MCSLYDTGKSGEFFLSQCIAKKAKLRSGFLNYERINNLAMQPAYLLTSINFVYYFTVFRYFGLQVARLKMRGTQFRSTYKILYGFGPGFAELVSREFELFLLMSGPPSD